MVASLGHRDPPTRVIEDCRFIVLMAAGHKPPEQGSGASIFFATHTSTPTDIVATKLSTAFSTGAFEKSYASSPTTQSTIEALGLVICFREGRTYARSHSLFRVIMNRVADHEEMWSPARDYFQGAYNANTADVPQVGHPRQLLRLLHYRIENQASTGSQSIHHLFFALAAASNKRPILGSLRTILPTPSSSKQ